MAEQNADDSVQIKNLNLKIKELEGRRNSVGAISPDQQVQLAEAYLERSETVPLEGGAAIPDLDAAAREYLDLWSRIDETWLPGQKYSIRGWDGDSLEITTKEEWSDELQKELARTYTYRGMTKFYTSQQEAARQDLDKAIPILERLESDKAMGGQTTVWNAGFIMCLRNPLRMAYATRAKCPTDLATQLHDNDGFIRLWTWEVASAPPEQLWIVALQYLQRVDIKKKLGDSAGVVEDLQKAITILEQLCKIQPNEPSYVNKLKTTRAALLTAKGEKIGSSIAKWFKRK